MANNEILQIVVFAIFSGVAIASLGERAKPLESLIEQVSHMMLEITGYVMKAAPLAVFGASNAPNRLTCASSATCHSTPGSGEPGLPS